MHGTYQVTLGEIPAVACLVSLRLRVPGPVPRFQPVEISIHSLVSGKWQIAAHSLGGGMIPLSGLFASHSAAQQAWAEGFVLEAPVERALAVVEALQRTYPAAVRVLA